MATTEPLFSAVFKWGLEGKAFHDLGDFDGATVMGPAIRYAKITPTNATALTQGPTRQIIVGAAGVLYGQDAFGNQVNGVPVVAGVNLISMSGIDNTGTTATNLWGVW